VSKYFIIREKQIFNPEVDPEMSMTRKCRVHCRGPQDDAIYQIWKLWALLSIVSDKKIFESYILKTYSLTLWPTNATNWNNLNNFGRGPPRDHSCKVWSKSNERFQRRCLSKRSLCTPHDNGQRPVTIAHPEHFVLWWAKNTLIVFIR